MLRDSNIESTKHALSSVRVGKEVQYLSDNLEFSKNAASLFERSPVNKDFISWEDHYQFDTLESLLNENRTLKRPINFRRHTCPKQHVCHLDSLPSTQELTLPPIAKGRNIAVMRSPEIERVMSKRSNYSVHSIPMNPSVDWNIAISSAVDNFETVCLKSDSLTRLSPVTSVSISPTVRNSTHVRLPEFYTEWELGHKPVFQPANSTTENEILLENGLKFDKVLEKIHPARLCPPRDFPTKDSKFRTRPQGQRRWQSWPRPHKNVKNEGWLSVTETRELEEEREEQERALAMSLANKKIDSYNSVHLTTTQALENTGDSDFFVEEEKDFKKSRIMEEWLHKWNLLTQVSVVTESDTIHQLGSVNQLSRLQAAGMYAIFAPATQQDVLQIRPEVEEILHSLLSDESTRVRVTAATVLSFSNPEHTSEIERVLLEGLSSLDTQERWLSCQALACMLRPVARVLQELSLHTVSDSPVERSRALTLLGRLSPHSVVVHAIACTLVVGVHWKQKIAGCSLVPLLHNGPKRDLQERLITVMWHDWHSKVREAAARALGLSGNGVLVHDQICAKLTDTENEDLRLDALHKIRELKPPTRRLIPGLLACLEDEVTSIQISCIKLVAELEIRDEDIIERLMELLRDDNCKVKLEAINSLSQLSTSVSSPQLIVPHLLWAGRYDRVKEVRITALRTLTQLAKDFTGDNNSDLREDIVSSLRDALGSDTEDCVRQEAERGLLELGEVATHEDTLIQAIREEIRKIGHPAEMSHSNFILTQAQCDVLAKSFHKYDREENGKIDVISALQLCSEVLGHELSTTELAVIKHKLEGREEESVVTFADYMDVMAEHMATTTRWGCLKTPLQSHIGIETLPEQLKRRIMRKGFEFNVMVVGESGVGKSTLINTIFKGQLSRQSCLPVPLQIPPTMQINSVCHLIEEEDVKLKLTLTDTPGFGDQVNNSKCWNPILEFVNDQYEHYLNEEVAVVRKSTIPDTRVHCCVYFLPPTGHCLRNIDIEFMKKLSNSVNIIPVIAKGDTLTLEERHEFRQRIKEDIAANNICIYPSSYEVEDSEEASLNSELDPFIPFAVIGSEQIYSLGSKRLLARKSRWGLVEVENPDHCDFIHFRNMLIRTHLQDLKEKTDKIHYEAYRRSRLQSPHHYAESNI